MNLAPAQNVIISPKYIVNKKEWLLHAYSVVLLFPNIFWESDFPTARSCSSQRQNAVKDETSRHNETEGRPSRTFQSAHFSLIWPTRFIGRKYSNIINDCFWRSCRSLGLQNLELQRLLSSLPLLVAKFAWIQNPVFFLNGRFKNNCRSYWKRHHYAWQVADWDTLFNINVMMNYASNAELRAWRPHNVGIAWYIFPPKFPPTLPLMGMEGVRSIES